MRIFIAVFIFVRLASKAFSADYLDAAIVQLWEQSDRRNKSYWQTSANFSPAAQFACERAEEFYDYAFHAPISSMPVVKVLGSLEDNDDDDLGLPGILYFASCNSSESSSTDNSPKKSGSVDDLSQPSSPVKKFGEAILIGVSSLADLAKILL